MNNKRSNRKYVKPWKEKNIGYSYTGWQYYANIVFVKNSSNEILYLNIGSIL